MVVDSNLFPYNLSIVTIMKGEAPYVKEWLDYHLLAGVDHFFIYDNESPDNLKEILQPYIDAGIVTYTLYAGKCRQMESYIDAVHRFRFLTRYMAWIDADEFIFPKSKDTIVEVLDEIFSAHPNASGLAVNIHAYGSNYQDTADYNRGVLERFTRRAGNDWTPPSWMPSQKGGSASVSTIANPRNVKLFDQPHAPIYFTSAFAINENGNFVRGFSSFPVSTEKIVMNHYSVKSKEEYAKKVERGNADWEDNRYSMDGFSHDSCNDEFDDGIIKYRDARQVTQIPTGGGIETLFQSKEINYGRLFNTLAQNLMPTLVDWTSPNYFAGKLENFLTCLNLTLYLKGKFLNDDGVEYFTRISLDAILKALYTNGSLVDALLLIDEMPKILEMPYPAVEKIRGVMIQTIESIMMNYRMSNYWLGWAELNHELKMLKSFKAI